MPTALKRVMVSLPKDLEEKVTLVAKAERRAMASMCVALIEAALKLPKYKEILHEEQEKFSSSNSADKKFGKDFSSYKELLQPQDAEMVEETGIDKLTPERLRELQALLGVLEKLKS